MSERRFVIYEDDNTGYAACHQQRLTESELKRRLLVTCGHHALDSAIDILLHGEPFAPGSGDPQPCAHPPIFECPSCGFQWSEFETGKGKVWVQAFAPRSGDQVPKEAKVFAQPDEWEAWVQRFPHWRGVEYAREWSLAVQQWFREMPCSREARA